MRKEEDNQLIELFSDPSNLLQLDSQVNVDQKQKEKSFAYSKEELAENKECEKVYTDVSDEWTQIKEPIKRQNLKYIFKLFKNFEYKKQKCL